MPSARAQLREKWLPEPDEAGSEFEAGSVSYSIQSYSIQLRCTKYQTLLASRILSISMQFGANEVESEPHTIRTRFTIYNLTGPPPPENTEIRTRLRHIPDSSSSSRPNFVSFEFVVWSLEFGIWSLEFDFGVWSLHGVWSLEFGVRVRVRGCKIACMYVSVSPSR